jgi:hypothetical protein
MGLARMLSWPRAAMLAGLVVWVACGGACENRQDPPRYTEGAAPDSKAQYVYTVRGQIATVPRPGEPLSALMIRHEPIPDFTDREGKVVGMPAMTMEFPPAPGLSLEGFAPGDKVEVVWEVWMTPRMRSEASRITRLPPDTELRFSR